MIPDEAVEAAAEWLPHSDDCEARPERDCTCWQPRVNLMRGALEAAAPHLRAQGWEAYESAPFEIRLTDDGKNWEPYKVNPFK